MAKTNTASSGGSKNSDNLGTIHEEYAKTSNFKGNERPRNVNLRNGQQAPKPTP